ncbi:MAG TPA: TrkA family potassium uptake protein [Vicinamibacteria bacterium]|nr:TrkA family potassium uptake protein [Vicinamibacteria bacterium]
MFFLVVGCGRFGSELAYGLHREGHQVTVIDRVGGSFEHLPGDYRGRTIEAEVLAEDVLKRAGVEQADGLAAVTNSDPVNAVVGHVAQTVFRVPSVVVRNYDPRYRPLLESFKLKVVSSTAWGARRIEAFLKGGASRTVVAVGHGEVEIQELLVPAAWAGKRLEEVLPAEGCTPVSLTRVGKAEMASGATRLEAGDVVHVGVTQGAAAALLRRLAGER